MIGIPPATAASYFIFFFFFDNILFICNQCLETSALLAVTTFLPFLNASKTISLAIPLSPPISSTRIS